jgi:hypothetical protein
MVRISTSILDSFRALRLFRQWDLGMDINLEDETSYTIQFQEAFLQYVENEYCFTNIDICLSKNPKANPATILSPLQRILDVVNLLMIHMICPAMMNNNSCLTMWLKRHLDETIIQYAQ